MGKERLPAGGSLAAPPAGVLIGRQARLAEPSAGHAHTSFRAISSSRISRTVSATITFPAITSACTIDVTVTGFNKIPYMGTVLVGATGVVEAAAGISNAGLYPNPAAAFSTLNYTIGSEENVTAYLSDALGRQVMNIVNGKMTSAGTYTAKVDLSSLQQGIYFCTLKAGEATVTKKLVVAR